MTTRLSNAAACLFLLTMPAAAGCSDEAPGQSEDREETSEKAGDGLGGGAGCPVGAEGCPCTAGGACDADLTCVSTRCVDLAEVLSDEESSARGSGGTEGGTGGSDSTGTGGTSSEFWDGCIHETVTGSTPAEQQIFWDPDEFEDEYAVSRNGVPYLLLPAIDRYGDYYMKYQGVTFSATADSFGTGYGYPYSYSSLDPFPSILCGAMNPEDSGPRPDCGLPAPLTDLAAIDTGLRWPLTSDGYPLVQVRLAKEGSLSGVVEIMLKRPSNILTPRYQSAVVLDGIWPQWDVLVDQESFGANVTFLVVEGPVELLSFDALAFVRYALDRHFVQGDEVLGVRGGVFVPGFDDTAEILDFCAEIETLP